MISTVGFIGYGNMGSALCDGIIRSNPGASVFIQEPDQEKAAAAASATGGTVNLEPEEFCSKCDIIIVAVKPQLLDKVLDAYAPFSADKKIISIAAGTTTSYFTQKLATVNVVRFMPNIAARVGKALTGVSAAEGASAEFKKQAMSIAESAGNAVELPESSMAAFTGLSGSGIAYVFSFIHALALGGTKEGIPYDTSLKIALGTIEGAVGLSREKGENPISLLSKVISPAGTTIQGVDALEEGKFTATVIDAVERASKRARELE